MVMSIEFSNVKLNFAKLLTWSKVICTACWLVKGEELCSGMTSGHSAAVCKKQWRGFFEHLLVEFGVGG